MLFGGRTGARPTISSKDLMLNLQFRAAPNNKRGRRSVSPTHFYKRSATLRVKKAKNWVLGDAFGKEGAKPYNPLPVER